MAQSDGFLEDDGVTQRWAACKQRRDIIALTSKLLRDEKQSKENN